MQNEVTLKGYPNGLFISDIINQRYKDQKNKPLLAMITHSIPKEEALNRGFLIYSNERDKIVDDILYYLKNKSKFFCLFTYFLFFFKFPFSFHRLSSSTNSL
jgi:hypothetical protein